MTTISPEDDALLTSVADTVFRNLDPNSMLTRALGESQGSPRQVFIVVYSAQGVIDNGGFAYFFGNDWPGTPPYSLFSNANREVGALDVAGAIDEAVALFRLDAPHRDRDARRRYLRQYCDGQDSEIEKLGALAINASARVFTVLANYARRHATELPGLGLPSP